MPAGGAGGGASVPWRKTPGKWCEYSITVSRSSGDVIPEEWEVVRKYFFDTYTHFFMAMERGDFEDSNIFRLLSETEIGYLAAGRVWGRV